MTKAEVLAALAGSGYVRGQVSFGAGVVASVEGVRADRTREPIAPGPLADAMTEPFLRRAPTLKAGWVAVFDVALSRITEHDTEARATTERVAEEAVVAERERVRRERDRVR